MPGSGLPALDAIDVPIVIAWSGRDRAHPFEALGAPLMERVPGATLLTLEGVGHVPMNDDPDLVVSTILRVTHDVDGVTMAV